MSDDEIRELLALEAQATPGRWVWWMREKPPMPIGAEPDSHIIIVTADRIMDAALLTDARNAIRPLCEQLLTTARERDALRVQVADLERRLADLTRLVAMAEVEDET